MDGVTICKGYLGDTRQQYCNQSELVTHRIQIYGIVATAHVLCIVSVTIYVCVDFHLLNVKRPVIFGDVMGLRDIKMAVIYEWRLT